MSNSRENRRLLYQRLIGQTVGGRYEILGLMGFGGMGAVYEAIQRNMNRRVALKYIPSHDPITAARFEREARTVSQLHHPNTVTVFDFGQTDDGFLYLSMELLSGRTLTEVIKEESPLPPSRAVHIASQICRSLAEAHQMGIVHRDIKPDNVMLIEVDGDPDVVKVLDFGIAKAVSGEDDVQLTGADRIIGTPRYMSPEQILSGSVDLRSDIYSLGCIIFEMLSGAPPFEASNTTALMISHAQDAPPPLSERLSEEALLHIPLALEQIIRRTLAKNPAERPQTTDELRLLLEDTLRGSPGVRPTHQPQTGPSPFPASFGPPSSDQAFQAPSTSKSSRGLLAAILLLFLLTTALIAFLFLSGPQEVDPPSEARLQAQIEPLPPSSQQREQEAPPPELPIEPTIQVRILTEPPEASLYEGDTPLGTTPFLLTLSPERKTLQYSLRAEGYQSQDVRLEIDGETGQNQTFSFQLTPLPAALEREERADPVRTPPRERSTRAPRPSPPVSEPDPDPEPEPDAPPPSRAPSVPIIDEPGDPQVPQVDRI